MKPKEKKQSKKAFRDHQILELASRSPLLRDGELELDSNAKISEGDDNGAYVQTWMWVSFDETELDKEKGNE